MTSEASKPTISPMGAALVAVISEASEQAIYMPVQRVNHHGAHMGSDMVAAIPIPVWERLVEACDQFSEEADERYL